MSKHQNGSAFSRKILVTDHVFFETCQKIINHRNPGFVLLEVSPDLHEIYVIYMHVMF